MKKLFMYLYLLLAVCVLFTSCSSDNDKDSSLDDEWKELSGTYTGSKLAILLNDEELTSDLDGRLVDLEAVSDETGVITLKNIIPDDKEVIMNVALLLDPVRLNLQYSKYLIRGKKELNGVTISLDGEYVQNALYIHITREVSSVLTGNLTMVIENPEGTQKKHAVSYINVSTGNMMNDAIVEGLGFKLGQYIGEEVDDIQFILEKNGSFNIKWTKNNGTGISEETTSELQFNYLVTDEQLLISFDKAVMGDSLFDHVLDRFYLNPDELLSLFVDLGGYYGLPVNYQFAEDGSVVNLYVTKNFIVSILPILSPVLPANIQQMLQVIESSLPSAEKLDFGFSFSFRK